MRPPTRALATVSVGAEPIALTLNTKDNRIYCAANWNHYTTIVDGFGDTVIASLSTGLAPVDFAYSAKHNEVYILNSYSYNLIALNGSNDAILASIGLEGMPWTLALNPVNKKLYCSNLMCNNLAIIDAVEDSILTTISTGIDPCYLLYAYNSNKIYCSNSGVGIYGGQKDTFTCNVAVINGENDSILARTWSGDAPYALTYNPTNHKIYCTALEGCDEVTIIDELEDSVIGRVSVGHAPIALLYNPINNKIYCANSRSEDVTIIDGVSDSIITTVLVGSDPRALLYNPSNNAVYCAAGNYIAVIDGESDLLLDTIGVAGSLSGPMSLAYNPLDEKVYCANYDGTVAIIDARTNSLKSIVWAGTSYVGNPNSIVYNPLNNKIYCANQRSNSISIIDGRLDSVLNTVSVGKGPVALELDTTSNKLYCANYDSSSISVIKCSPRTEIRDTLWVNLRGLKTIALEQIQSLYIGVGNESEAHLDSVRVMLDLPPEIEYMPDTLDNQSPRNMKLVEWDVVRDVGALHPHDFKEIEVRVKCKKEAEVGKTIEMLVKCIGIATGYPTFVVNTKDQMDIKIVSNYVDVLIAANGSRAVLGWQKKYWIWGYNDGGKQANNVAITAYHDPKVTFVEASPGGTYDAATRLVTWSDLGYLCPNCMILKWMKIGIPFQQDLIGKMIGFTATIETSSKEYSDANNRAMDAEKIFASFDPNDKGVSPQGYAEEGYIPGDQLLTYFIYFENEGNMNATHVRIVDTPDANLDCHTIFEGPRADSGTFFYNGSTREIVWDFPNINLPPKEERMVNFSVRPMEDLPSGTIIKNRAIIYFDANPGVLTPEVLNTIDGQPPWSYVVVLPNTQSTDTFHVFWTGRDDSLGSGIKAFTIRFSDNGGPDSTWIVSTADTCTVFAGRPGHTYSFYSIAEDNVGNIEDRPQSPDATTTIEGAPGLTISIFQNSVLTKFVDLYVASTMNLREPPKMSIRVGSNKPDSITMGELATQTYKGSYVFNASGTCSLFVHAVSNLDIVKDTVRLFDVQLIESQSGGKLVSYDGRLRLIVPCGTVSDNMYFTCVPLFEEKLDTLPHGEFLGIPYQLGPARRIFGNDLTIVFPLDDYNLGEEDGSRICIYKQEQDKWIMIISYLDPQRNTISAKVNELGIYRLGYGQSKPQISVPDRFELLQNYPNPFNPITVIQYALPRDCEVQITIYNILGQKTKILINEYQQTGYKTVEWDGKNDRGEEVASGIYFYKIKAGEFTQSKKMVILK